MSVLLACTDSTLQQESRLCEVAKCEAHTENVFLLHGNYYLKKPAIQIIIWAVFNFANCLQLIASDWVIPDKLISLRLQGRKRDYCAFLLSMLMNIQALHNSPSENINF